MPVAIWVAMLSFSAAARALAFALAFPFGAGAALFLCPVMVPLRTVPYTYLTLQTIYLVYTSVGVCSLTNTLLHNIHIARRCLRT